MVHQRPALIAVRNDLSTAARTGNWPKVQLKAQEFAKNWPGWEADYWRALAELRAGSPRAALRFALAANARWQEARGKEHPRLRTLLSEASTKYAESKAQGIGVRSSLSTQIVADLNHPEQSRRKRLHKRARRKPRSEVSDVADIRSSPRPRGMYRGSLSRLPNLSQDLHFEVALGVEPVSGWEEKARLKPAVVAPGTAERTEYELGARRIEVEWSRRWDMSFLATLTRIIDS